MTPSPQTCLHIIQLQVYLFDFIFVSLITRSLRHELQGLNAGAQAFIINIGLTGDVVRSQPIAIEMFYHVLWAVGSKIRRNYLQTCNALFKDLC